MLLSIFVDEHDIGKLHAKHNAEVTSLCQGFAIGVHSAEDLAQDVWLRVCEQIHEFDDRGDGSFRAWLCQVARNVCIDRTRSEAFRTPEDPNADFNFDAVAD